MDNDTYLKEKPSKLDIRSFIGKTNIIEELPDDVVKNIERQVCDGYEIDHSSMHEWNEKTREAMELARQVFAQRDFPFRNAASVQYPLITTASVQFAARTYPNVMRGPDIVRGLVVGQDEQGIKASKANRVAQHMSYQLLYEMTEFEEEVDKLLAYLPVTGCGFMKTYFHPVLGRVKSEFRRASDVVVNYYAKSIEEAPRITDIISLYPNQIRERILNGAFIDFDYGQASETIHDDQEINSTDPQQEHVFLEQHGYFDLDGDGYEEPYIFVVHKDSHRLVRIAPRFYEESVQQKEDGTIIHIEPDQYFSKFVFMPSPDGGFYDLGFGQLLGPLNRAINSSTNQLLDAGTLYNANAGFIGKTVQFGPGRGGGQVEFQLGEWKTINYSGDDIRKSLMPLPVKEPSMTVMSLLQFLLTAGERLSSVTEIMTGDQSAQGERPTTTLARIEQGSKVFTSIQRRVFRGFKDVLKKIFKLNGRFLDPEVYFRILDIPVMPQEFVQQIQTGKVDVMSAMQMIRAKDDFMAKIAREDYDYKSCDVKPSMDPEEVSNTQKLIRAQALMQMRGMGLNDQEIMRMYLEALQIPQPERLLKAPPSPPPPEVVFRDREISLKERQFMFEVTKFSEEKPERAANLAKMLASAEKDLAQAEAQESGQQLQIYQGHLKAMVEELKFRLKREERLEQFAMQQQAAQAQQAQVQQAQAQQPVGEGNGADQSGGMGLLEEPRSDEAVFQGSGTV